MENLKKFLKWPTTIISLVAFLVFLVVLVATCARDFTPGTYVYAESMAGMSMKIEIELNKDDTGSISMFMSYAGEKEVTVEDFKFKVVDGELYSTSADAPTEYEKVGTIDAFELKMVDEESSMSITATNESAEKLKTASIVLVSVFGGIAILSSAFICFDKKKNVNQPQIDNTVNQ